MVVHKGVLLMHKNKATLDCVEYLPMLSELKPSLASPRSSVDALRRIHTYVEVTLVFNFPMCIKLTDDLDVVLHIFKILFTIASEVLTELIASKIVNIANTLSCVSLLCT